MLVLSRKPGEEIVIGDNIRISVLRTQGGRVRLGITAPSAVHIARKEIVRTDASRALSDRKQKNTICHAQIRKAITMSDKTTYQLNLAESFTGKDRVGIIACQEESARNFSAVKPARILLAEDDDEMRSVIALHLRREGPQVTECRDGMELLDHLAVRR